MAFTTVYRVKYTESERGWGLDTWYTDYASYADAMNKVNLTNDKFKTGEDYYVHADYIGPNSVEVPNNVEEEKKMAKETVAQRRARETRTREADDRYMLWEAEKPMRLLCALARANDLEVEARVYYRADNILYYEFKFSGYDYYHEPVVELGESIMDLINQELDSIEAKRAKKRRLRQVKEELLARLSDEEREALGL
jgi:hypothetical protein